MILVTGATGLVGGHLLWQLLQTNDKVIAIKRTSSNLEPLRTIFRFYTHEPELFFEKIEWRIADILDENALENALAGITTIYHCAAVVSLGNGSDTMIETNVKGTKNIVALSLKNSINHFCFVSSIAACGHEMKGKYSDENSEWIDSEHRSAYSRSKYYSEQEVWEGIRQGLNAVIVNPGVILGVSGTESGSSQLFSQVRKGLPFYTSGGSGYTDVRDVVKAMIDLTTSEIWGERFIMVAENCSNKQILSWIADGFGKSRPRICVNKNLLLLIALLSEILGKLFRFQPLIDRSMARSATNREFYSSQKIINQIDFTFSSIEKCIQEVSRNMKNN